MNQFGEPLPRPLPLIIAKIKKFHIQPPSAIATASTCRRSGRISKSMEVKPGPSSSSSTLLACSLGQKGNSTTAKGKIILNKTRTLSKVKVTLPSPTSSARPSSSIKTKSGKSTGSGSVKERGRSNPDASAKSASVENIGKKQRIETQTQQPQPKLWPGYAPMTKPSTQMGLSYQDFGDQQIISNPDIVFSPSASPNRNATTVVPQNFNHKPAAMMSLETVTEQFEIMLTFEKCFCLFCYEELAIGEGVVLQDCCHAFCRACLVTVVDNSSSDEILCPLNSECGGRLFHREIKALVPVDVYERYSKRTDNTIKAMMLNMFVCKTKNCSGCCEYQPDSKIFLCTVCNKSNCLSCKAIHEGLECKNFQALLSSTIQEGKSPEETVELINSQLTNGWEQVLKSVSTWMGSSPSMRNRSQDYTKILQKMSDQDIWLSTSEFECPICISIIPVGEGIILQDCLHTVCRICAIGLVEYATEPDVKCPYQDGNYSCTSHLKPREIKALVSPELHDTFLTRSVKQAESVIPNSFHCKTPDCHGWCVFEEGAVEFLCEICSKKNCLPCQVIHENVSCADYQNKLVQNANDDISKKSLEELIAKGQCMRCPTCKIPTEKTAGCDWVVCLVCKTEICWATKGPRWGPKGKGDTSGGCKCKRDGKTLCTLKCMNCH